MLYSSGNFDREFRRSNMNAVLRLARESVLDMTVTSFGQQLGIDEDEVRELEEGAISLSSAIEDRLLSLIGKTTNAGSLRDMVVEALVAEYVQFLDTLSLQQMAEIAIGDRMVAYDTESDEFVFEAYSDEFTPFLYALASGEICSGFEPDMCNDIRVLARGLGLDEEIDDQDLLFWAAEHPRVSILIGALERETQRAQARNCIESMIDDYEVDLEEERNARDQMDAGDAWA